jgi:hypothetical protein
MGVRSFSEAHDVDLIMNGSGGRAVPTRAARASRPGGWRPSPPGAHATILWSRAGPQGDHRIVASLRTGRARTQVREASRGSRNWTTRSVVLQPGHRHTAARGAPACVPMVTPTGARSDLPSESPNAQREGIRKPRQPDQLARVQPDDRQKWCESDRSVTTDLSLSHHSRRSCDGRRTRHSIAAARATRRRGAPAD